MRKFTDGSGWVRTAVCCAALLLHHSLRDALITALPTIAAATSPPPPANTTTPSPNTTDDYTTLTTTTDDYTTLTTTTKVLRGTGPSDLSFIATSRAPTPGSIDDPVSVKAFTTSGLVPQFGSPPGAAPLAAGPRRAGRVLRKASDLSHPSDMSLRYLKTPHSVYQKVNPLERLHQRVFKTHWMRDDVGNVPVTVLRESFNPVEMSAEGHSGRGGRGHSGRRPSDGPGASVSSVSPTSVEVGGSWWGYGEVVEDEEVLQEVDDFEDPRREWRDFDLSNLKAGWSLPMEGVVISAVYWGWLLTALLADSLIDRVGAGVVLAGSVGATGVVGLVTHGASLGGPWVLLAFRVLQGAFQGFSYPSVVRVLEGVPEAVRASAALLVFTGPYLGTSVGAGLAGIRQWYIIQYIAGGLALLLTPVCLMLPYHHTTTHREGMWGRVLRSRPVWACVGVHVANTWVLHTLLVGAPFCLVYSTLSQPSAVGWCVVVVALVVAAVVRPLLFLSPHFADRGPLNVLNRRRVPVVVGSFLVLVTSIVLATTGTTSTGTLVGVAAGVGGVGVGVARVGYRLNLVDVAPWQLWRLSRVLEVAGVTTAAITPLLLTALAQVGGVGWVGVWVVPLAALLPAAGLYLFLLTTNQQPWDEPGGGVCGAGEGTAVGGRVSSVNGFGPTRDVRMSLRSGQSFKTAHSALSFKTAISRSRTRTISCRTVDDDLETDMHSVVDEASVDCCSVNDEVDPECYSVVSSNTFKSDGADMQSVVDGLGPDRAKQEQEPPSPDLLFGSVLCNGTATDRTTAWLSCHHHLAIGVTRPTQKPPTKAEAHRRNAIYGLFW